MRTLRETLNGLNGWRRLWVVLSAVWILVFPVLAEPLGVDNTEAWVPFTVWFGVPLAVYWLGAAGAWVIRGFQG